MHNFFFFLFAFSHTRPSPEYSVWLKFTYRRGSEGWRVKSTGFMAQTTQVGIVALPLASSVPLSKLLKVCICQSPTREIKPLGYVSVSISMSMPLSVSISIYTHTHTHTLTIISRNYLSVWFGNTRLKSVFLPYQLPRSQPGAILAVHTFLANWCWSNFSWMVSSS